MLKIQESRNVSPYSNNAYKQAAPPGTIKVSIKGGALHMPQQKLTIIPVTLQPEFKRSSVFSSTEDPNIIEPKNIQASCAK